MHQKRHICNWILLSVFFFMQYFIRISPTIMTIDFMRHFHMSIRHIGLLSSTYFLTYTASQIPAGYIMKHFETRYIMSSAALGCCCTALLFCIAPDFSLAILSLALFAFSSSFCFIGLVFYATAYIPEYRSLLIGLTQSLSMAAGFVATNTVSYFLNFYSWQSIFQSVSMILAILSACIFLVLNDKPVKIQQTDPPPLHKTISIYSYKETWANALYAGFLYSPMMILSEGGLGVQMLHSIHELPESSIAFAISMSFIGRMIGGPLYGALLKTYTCLQIMRFSSLATFTVLPIIIYFPMSVSFLSLSLFMFGLSNAGTIGCYVIASEQHGLKNSSIVIGFTSMMSMLIGSVLIGSLPAILEYSAQAIIINDLPYYLAQDYQSIFGITMIFFTLASYFLTIAIKHPIKSIKKSP